MKQYCPNCGKRRGYTTRPYYKPSTPKEIAKAEKLRERIGQLYVEGEHGLRYTLMQQANKLAQVYATSGFKRLDAKFRHDDGETAKPRPGIAYRETREITDELQSWVFDTFCTTRCAAEFGMAAFKAGYKRRNQ